MREASSDMPVTLLCPNLRCRAVLQVPDTVRGKNVRCGHCGTIFTVPQKVESRRTASAEAAPQATETTSEKA